ncbi:double-strand break repair protein AddB [Pontibaca methylaminivorans]|uniref:Double-strand break repair protein AddB n=1 Tax=Pontibaca methylaminivorans TaxID=515897 RepID=A0A1R3WSL2_9RHOB|nr:double-strand break repair protein AddB [Pontibaca methylaminivorans]SIT80965.1 double-strand break repair protein AddB [Pontibaca methylaminivorans]
MFEPAAQARVFALPCGVDFPAELVAGLLGRSKGPPEALARVHLIVNTRRMARRLRAILDRGPARLLPRILLLEDLALAPLGAPLPPPVPPLRRRLELAQLVHRLLERQPDLAARASAFDLADSLADLMEEMQGEGVGIDAIRALRVEDMSGHWERALAFFDIAATFLAQSGARGLDPQARQRRLVESLAARWKQVPPAHPVILAGSTGSRGTTAMLMRAVARLPQGAVVLPGFDFDLPAGIWDALDPQGERPGAEDHPQYRFRRLMRDLDIAPDTIRRWTAARPPSPARNRLVSLALRPAPVTDAWLSEGPALSDLAGATGAMTLVEAPSPRAEALAIALRLRQAVENGESAALITPDRLLTRQVTAALERWEILPDDSAGMPLQLSPPGRFLRQVAGLFRERLSCEALLALLKHPLTHSGDGRGDHLRLARDFEIFLRSRGPAFPDATGIAAGCGDSPETQRWGRWIGEWICGQHIAGEAPLADWVARLRAVAESIAAGAGAAGSGGLWDRNAGQQALEVVESLAAEADHGGAMTASDFGNLLGTLLAAREVRDRDAPRPDVMIWGTLEARVQGAGVVILGGLNEGIWPDAARPDPWLNRALRMQAGLLLPERRIGLAAHDFQQAIAAPEVWLTRATRTNDADSVPSRWLNRLVNLLNGLPEAGGRAALEGMRARGRGWLDRVTALEAVARQAPAPRPAPAPPLIARPRRLSITEIRTLIRDPYAIYARHVLRLRPLDPLVKTPDARLRGIAVHDFLERLIRTSLEDRGVLARDGFLALAGQVLSEHVAWPAARRLWHRRLEGIAEPFLAHERAQRETATPAGLEIRARLELSPPGFTLTGRADRIDRSAGGSLVIYDYKTGNPPTAPVQRRFDKQLLLAAVIAEHGGFEGIAPAPVSAAAFVGVGTQFKTSAAPLDEEPPAQVLDEFRELITAYLDPRQGFTARLAMQKDSDPGDYDQLARFGEWNRTSAATTEVLT